MSYPTQGASNRQIYDCCAYAQSLQQSVDPMQYQLYFGAHENCSKCIDKRAWFKQDREIVDIESDLWNINRPLSNLAFKLLKLYLDATFHAKSNDRLAIPLAI